jgi:hypothetical protein
MSNNRTCNHETENESGSGGTPFPRRRFLAAAGFTAVASVGIGTGTASANDPNPRFVERIDVENAGLSVGSTVVLLVLLDIDFNRVESA